jgi:hypothetical protein
MNEDKRTSRAAAGRQSPKPEPVRQQTQQSLAKATAQLDRPATEERPSRHLRYHADEDLSGLDTKGWQRK